MTNDRLRILLVEDNPDDRELIVEMLAQPSEISFDVQPVHSLAAALGRLREQSFAAVLLDLNLPDSDGLATFLKAREVVGQTPILVLTGLNDDSLGLRIVSDGGQDFLVKGEFQTNALVRAVLYAVERKELEEKLRASEAARNAAQEQLAQRLQHEKSIVEEELSRVREDLVRSTRLATVGRVAAQVAHELRNPLGAVRNAAYYVREELTDEQRNLLPMMQIIDDELMTAEIIIRNLLSTTNPREPDLRLVDATEQARKSLERLGEKESLSLRLEAPEQPLHVHFDPLQCRQLLDNLLGNARDAVGDKGSIWVQIQTNDDRCELRIYDSGPGVPEDVREAVFEPFFTTKQHGVGLGLSICRQIVEQHGGRISFEDENGCGTSVLIEIPSPPQRMPVGVRPE